ncbi:MAG: amidohydrolase, partial [Pseudomonadota bacterium]
TERGLDAARAVFGADCVSDEAPRMGASEDFAQALALAPGAFGNIGNGDSAPLHNAAYDFNDEALEPGARWFVDLVHQRLSVGPGATP